MSTHEPSPLTDLDTSRLDGDDTTTGHGLSNVVVLANLQRIRKARGRGGKPMSFATIIRAAKAFASKDWGDAKVRILFGSRGTPNYRWDEIVALSIILDTTILDIVLPDPDGDRFAVREAAAALGIPLDDLDEIYSGGAARRYFMEEILEGVVSLHPALDAKRKAGREAILQVKEAGGPWRDLFAPLVDDIRRTEESIHKEIDRQFETVGIQSGHRSKFAMSPTLWDMANAEMSLTRKPLIDVEVRSDDGEFEKILAKEDLGGELLDRMSLDRDKARVILAELGVLPTEDGS